MAYQNSLHTTVSKPIGINGLPTDARSYFYNTNTFSYRPYNSTSEVLSYLLSASNRKGQFPIFVLDTGIIYEYWFRNGTLDSDLILKESGQAEDATTTIKGIIRLNGDLSGTALNPTVPALANKEILANKVTDLTTNDNTHYPTVAAVNTALNTKQDLLGYTPEDTNNKTIDLSSNDDIHYPTTQAVKTITDQLDSNVANEISDREDADIVLQSNIDSEASTRASNDTTLQTNITIETSNRVAADALLVPKTTTINGHNLSTNISLNSTDIGLGNVPNIDATNPSNITQDSTHRFTTDTEKATWNAKQNALGYTPENIANKNISNGYAGLDSGGLIPSSLLPSYVDDVLEFANLASFPSTGETGKIYVALDTNKTYRWGGSVYIEISASPGSTDALPEGSVNLYYTNARVKTYADTLYPSLTGSYSNPTWINSIDVSKLTGTTLPTNILYSSLTTLGTITTGVWNGSIINPQYGGTGQSSYTIGDLLYASGSTTLSKLNDVATGNVLLSGGIGASPLYGKVGLTTHVTGTLPIGNGGTGTATTFTQGSVIFAGVSGVYSQDNSNFYYASSALSINTNGDQNGTNAINIYGQYDAYMPQSSIGTITSGTALPGITASTSRGTGASPTINNTGDLIGGHSFWAYSGSTPAYNLHAGAFGQVTGSTTANLGGEYQIWTKADGGALTQHLTVANNGDVTISALSPTLKFITSGDAGLSFVNRTTVLNALTLNNNVNSVGGLSNALLNANAGSGITRSDSTMPSGSSITLTVQKWIKVATTGGAQPCNMISYGSSTTGLDITVYTDGGLLIINGSTTILNVVTGVNFRDGNWHNIAVKMNGSAAAYIIDGVSYATSTISAYNIVLNGTLKTNGLSGNKSTVGSEDQLLIYNTAVATTDIQANYNAGSGTINVYTTGLVARYEFEGNLTDTNPNVTPVTASFLSTSTYTGVGNGKVPLAGSLQLNNTFIAYKDGVNTGEYGQASFGNVLSGTFLQGNSIYTYINSKYPFIQGNDGNILISKSNTNQTTRGLSALSVVEGVAIGTYALMTTAPTSGLIVSGTTGLGTASPSGSYILDIVGNVRNTGSINLAGSTSGLITLQTQAAAGTYNWNYPTTAGTAGQVLTSQGGSTTAMTWTTLGTTIVDITGTTQQAVINTKYIADNASLVSITIPLNANSALGDQVLIRGRGVGGWKLLQNASDVIHGATDTTIGTGGSLASQTRYDCVTIEKIGANEWTIINNRGTLTIV